MRFNRTARVEISFVRLEKKCGIYNLNPMLVLYTTVIKFKSI